MLRPDDYSNIAVEARRRPPEGDGLQQLYDLALKPDKIVTYLVVCASVQYRKIAQVASELQMRDERSLIYIEILVLTVICGLRAYQSIFLAKKDYKGIWGSFLDVITFLLVLLFTSGVLPLLFANRLDNLLLIYAGIAFVMLVNFLSLRFYRLRKARDTLDLPLEHRIQSVNAITFAILTIALMYAWFALRNGGALVGGDPLIHCHWAIGIGIVAVVLNIIHSHELSYVPKLLLRNSPDAPLKKIGWYRYLFWREAARINDAEILQRCCGAAKVSFIALTTQRATRSEVPEIATQLLKEFHYIFGTIFQTSNRVVLNSRLNRVLLSCGGFGEFGYRNFIVIRRNGESTGFFYVKTEHRTLLYDTLRAVSLILQFSWIDGPRRSFRYLRAARQVQQSQPEAAHRQICLQYLVIYPKHRRKGIAGAVLELLIGGLVLTSTNGINADKIVLTVRERNSKAIQLFRNLGFRESSATVNHKEPHQLAEAAGKPITMTIEPYKG